VTTDAGRRVRGRLAPDAMYPAGVESIRTRRVTLPSGLTLRVADAGHPSAQPVLLLHGWGASLYMWRAWFEPLSAAGFRVVAVDLPGHGLSDKPVAKGAYTLAQQVSVMRDFIVRERLDNVHLVAQSMGGSVALELALQADRRIGQLALINPVALGRVLLQPLVKFVTPPLVDKMLGGRVPRWMIANAQRLAYADPSRVSPRDIDEYWAPTQFADFFPSTRRMIHEFQWRREPVDRMAARLASLGRAPLVVLSGRDRLVGGARPYAAALRRLGASLDVLELATSGHAVNEEEPERVLPRVLAHLAGRAADG
jgi:pimeloyl-ACP methyl ester carboxylesterase